MKIHGISTDYMRDLDVYGLKPQPADLVQMKIHGIEPEFIREARDLGYRFTAARSDRSENSRCQRRPTCET